MSPGVFLGLSSGPSATASRWPSGHAPESVPFGKYRRGGAFYDSVGVFQLRTKPGMKSLRGIFGGYCVFSLLDGALGGGASALAAYFAPVHSRRVWAAILKRISRKEAARRYGMPIEGEFCI